MYDSYEEMQREDARQVLRALVFGMHPDTGARLPKIEVLETPTVLRALMLAIEAVTTRDSKLPSPTAQDRANYPRAGHPWPHEEDERLTAEFKDGMNVVLMADVHQRTEGAITSRLTHLKLVESRDEVRELLRLS